MRKHGLLINVSKEVSHFVWQSILVLSNTLTNTVWMGYILADHSRMKKNQNSTNAVHLQSAII